MGNRRSAECADSMVPFFTGKAVHSGDSFGYCVLK